MKIAPQGVLRKSNLSRSLSIAGPVEPSRGGRPGATLVLNAISAQRQNLLDQYPLSLGLDLVKRKPIPTGKTAAKATATLGSPYDEGRITHLSVYRTACKVHRYIRTPREGRKHRPGVVRGVIDSFSDKSRARLKHVAGNCFPLLISQFCLTYSNENTPKDGQEAHRQLHRFLTAVTRKFRGSTYLWVLEFQVSRGVPHFHVFFSFPPSQQKQVYMTKAWVRITKGTEAQYRVHAHPKNFTPWDMKKGGYLCKYLEKKEQKNVPSRFENVGRFWGCSRNMVPHPDQWFFDDLSDVSVWLQDKITGEAHEVSLTKTLYRTLRKHHEVTIRNVRKKLGIKGRKKSRVAKQGLSTVNLPSGGLVARQVLEWFREKTLQVVPF